MTDKQKPGVEVIIHPYDMSWPHWYAAEVARMREVMENNPEVQWPIYFEHIGSTAIPGLAAKPVIDVMIGVQHFTEQASALLEQLTNLGYVYLPEFEARIPERRFLRGQTLQNFPCHIHMVPHLKAFWNDHILFRDLLRSNTELAGKYQELKLNLSARRWPTTSHYSDAKTEFIEAALARARK